MSPKSESHMEQSLQPKGLSKQTAPQWLPNITILNMVYLLHVLWNVL